MRRSGRASRSGALEPLPDDALPANHDRPDRHLPFPAACCAAHNASCMKCASTAGTPSSASVSIAADATIGTPHRQRARRRCECRLTAVLRFRIGERMPARIDRAHRLEGTMLEVGDTVVTMGAPGRFTVITVAGPLVTIENGEGVRKTVLESNLRQDRARARQRQLRDAATMPAPAATAGAAASDPRQRPRRCALGCPEPALPAAPRTTVDASLQLARAPATERTARAGAITSDDKGAELDKPLSGHQARAPPARTRLAQAGTIRNASAASGRTITARVRDRRRSRSNSNRSEAK